MATPAPSQPAPARRKKPPPPLSNAYQKAHRTYVLSAALLASWELIGIDLNTKEKWGVELKSPQAVPLVLLAMIIYFGYRLTVEWMQCDEERRSHRAANVDFVVAHTIAGLALLISLIQYLLRIRIADIIANAPSGFVFYIFAAVFIPILPMWAWNHEALSTFRRTRLIVRMLIVLAIADWVVIVILIFRHVRWIPAVLGGAGGILTGIMLTVLFRTVPRVMEKRRLTKMAAK